MINKNNLAVIKTGGKQYIVTPGKKIKIEKIEKKEGEKIVFDQVLLLKNDEKITIGKPIIEKTKVTAKILQQAKDKKIIIFKYKAKKRYKKKQGHRQPYTFVEILNISE